MPKPDADRLASLVAGLSASKLPARQDAEREIERLGALAAPALRETLRGESPLALRQRVERLLAKAAGPVRVGDPIRVLRAIELLEMIGTRSARGVLDSLALGAADARPTRDAKAALARLAASARAVP